MTDKDVSEELNKEVIVVVEPKQDYTPWTPKTKIEKIDYFLSNTWKPILGFSFAAYINSLWLLPIFHIAPVIMSPDIVIVLGGILGVATYWKGKAQADPSIPTINKG